MSIEIGDQWARFERWSTRYRMSARRFVQRKVYLHDDDVLFIAKSHELIDSWASLSWSDVEERIEKKIAFLRGYLVDISFDGKEFMFKQSRFLTSQYPRYCERSFGIWFEQDIGNESLEPGGYYGFQEFDVSVFLNEIDDMDFASARVILPFDRLIIRRPNGAAWTVRDINNINAHITNDLEEGRLKAGMFDVASTLLQLDFRETD